MNPLNYFDRDLTILSLIPLLIGFSIIYFIIPSSRRIELCLALIPIWTGISRMSDFLFLYSLTKVTIPFPYLILALTSLAYLRPVRTFPLWIWGLPFLIVVSAFQLITSADWVTAVPIRCVFGLSVVCALLLGERCSDAKQLDHWLRALFYGVAIPTIILFLAIPIKGYGAFQAGHGRFIGFGLNPNQVSYTCLTAACLATICFLRSRNFVLRLLCISISFSSILMIVLTGSRQAVVVYCLVHLFILFEKKGWVVVLLGSIALVPAGIFIVGQQEAFTAGGRFSTLQTTRFEIFSDYARSISERPILGLLETQGKSSLVDESIGHHTHNAYLLTVYAYGIPMALAIGFLFFLSLIKGCLGWIRMSSYNPDCTLVRFFVFVLFAGIVHSNVTYATIWPTFSWSFLLCFSLGLLIAPLFSRRRVASGPQPLPPSRW